jgi:hypothetical protein
MSFQNPQPPQVNLASHKFDRPFFVDMEAFFEFSFWMTEELLDLEARHKQKPHEKRLDVPQQQAHSETNRQTNPVLGRASAGHGSHRDDVAEQNAAKGNSARNDAAMAGYLRLLKRIEDQLD